MLGGGEYGDWVEGRREAEVALEQREEKLFASAKTIESQLELLGELGHRLFHQYFRFTLCVGSVVCA